MAKKEDFDRIDKEFGNGQMMIGEEAKKKDEPEEPVQTEKKIESSKYTNPKVEPIEQPKQISSVRIEKAISLGFNFAVGFWMFTLIVWLVVLVIMFLFFRQYLPF